jgi:hypothetical protein
MCVVENIQRGFPRTERPVAGLGLDDVDIVEIENDPDRAGANGTAAMMRMAAARMSVRRELAGAGWGFMRRQLELTAPRRSQKRASPRPGRGLVMRSE